MIKYLGSKRLLVPVLGAMARATGAHTALDLFTGTTRVAQEFKRGGMEVTAVDVATYSEVLARCYIATDARTIDLVDLSEEIARLNIMPGHPGYVTRVFCEEARFFHPDNGVRIDAIRDAIEVDHAGDVLHPILLTALMEAADRVDSTTGQQMAYLKEWAPRAHRSMHLRVPELLEGTGTAVCGDARDVAPVLDPVDIAYLDPPYNQHRYFTNYHVWETLTRWDSPATYGVARKRIDARDPRTQSAFNRRREMPAALAGVIEDVQARVVMVSYNDEAWVGTDQIVGFLRTAGHEDVRVVGFDSRRYVGAKIGVFNPQGEKVGRAGHLRNTEYVFVAGPRELVGAAVTAAEAFGGVPVEVVDVTSGPF